MLTFHLYILLILFQCCYLEELNHEPINFKYKRLNELFVERPQFKQISVPNIALPFTTFKRNSIQNDLLRLLGGTQKQHLSTSENYPKILASLGKDRDKSNLTEERPSKVAEARLQKHKVEIEAQQNEIQDTLRSLSKAFLNDYAEDKPNITVGRPTTERITFEHFTHPDLVYNHQEEIHSTEKPLYQQMHDVRQMRHSLFQQLHNKNDKHSVYKSATDQLNEIINQPISNGHIQDVQQLQPIAHDDFNDLYPPIQILQDKQHRTLKSKDLFTHFDFDPKIRYENLAKNDDARLNDQIIRGTSNDTDTSKSNMFDTNYDVIPIPKRQIIHFGQNASSASEEMHKALYDIRPSKEIMHHRQKSTPVNTINSNATPTRQTNKGKQERKFKTDHKQHISYPTRKTMYRIRQNVTRTKPKIENSHRHHDIYANKEASRISHNKTRGKFKMHNATDASHTRRYMYQHKYNKTQAKQKMYNAPHATRPSGQLAMYSRHHNATPRVMYNLRYSGNKHGRHNTTRGTTTTMRSTYQYNNYGVLGVSSTTKATVDNIAIDNSSLEIFGDESDWYTENFVQTPEPMLPEPYNESRRMKPSMLDPEQKMRFIYSVLHSPSDTIFADSDNKSSSLMSKVIDGDPANPKVPNQIAEAFLSILKEDNEDIGFPATCGCVLDRGGTLWDDKLPNEGTISIEDLPWFGVLYYPHGEKNYFMPVVLVTMQLVVGSAFDFLKLPKDDIRTKARVVLGSPCTYDKGLKIAEYNFHEEFQRETYSSLVLIQLNTYSVTLKRDIHPICPPPTTVKPTVFYALVPSENCESSDVTLYEMEYVDLGQCEVFYQRLGLDMQSMWPTNVACGQARTKRKCIWKDGTILVIKQDNKWHFMGFGISGPGCDAPARFIDYTPYNKWVMRSLDTMGHPAITKLDDNILIFRRTNHIQRFDSCDVDELHYEIYSDLIQLSDHSLDRPIVDHRVYTYNLTIRTDIDYTCALFKVETAVPAFVMVKPLIELKSYCQSKTYPFCYQAGTQEIEYYIKIKYKCQSTFKLQMYGRQRPILSQKDWNSLINKILLYDKGEWEPPFTADGDGPVLDNDRFN